MVYRPIQSVLLHGADPVALARAYCETLGSNVVYIADLDAIMGSGENLAVISETAAALPQLELLVDAGIHSALQARRLLDAGATKVIIASEALASFDAVPEILVTLGTERVLVSIDIKDHAVIWRGSSAESKDPGAAAAHLLSLGFREAILLEMDRIGTGAGAGAALLSRVTAAAPEMGFIVGGGIGTAAELLHLKRAGACGVLLATALHDGAITRHDLIRIGAGP